MEIVALEASHAVHDVVAAVEVVAEVARHSATGARWNGKHQEAGVGRRLSRLARDADARGQRSIEVPTRLEHDVPPGARSCARQGESPRSPANDRDLA